METKGRWGKLVAGIGLEWKREQTICKTISLRLTVNVPLGIDTHTGTIKWLLLIHYTRVAGFLSSHKRGQRTRRWNWIWIYILYIHIYMYIYIYIFWIYILKTAESFRVSIGTISYCDGSIKSLLVIWHTPTLHCHYQIHEFEKKYKRRLKFFKINWY